METQLVLILAFIVVCFLILKAFKAIITVAGSLFLLITFAFFLRSQNVINFDVPKDFNLKSLNFSINEKDFSIDNKKIKEEDKKEESSFKNSKNKVSIEQIKEQEMAEEANIKKDKN